MTIPHAPAYIPGELCIAVGLDPASPPDDCMALVKADVAAGDVSAPADEVAALREVVDEAQQNDIDLKIVLVAANPARDTALRDVATVVGSEHPGSTVLVLSPSYVGTYSSRFDRAKLEVGEDHAKTGVAAHSAHNFLDELNAPAFAWTAFTIVLLFAVVSAAVGTRLLQRYSRRSDASVDSLSDSR